MECSLSETVIKTVFREFDYGMAPILVVNRLNNFRVTVNEVGESKKYDLAPNTLLLYAWDNPVGNRQISWSCGELKDQEVNLDKIELKSTILTSDTDAIHYVVFLDGLQKVLMFVDDLYNLHEDIKGSSRIEGGQILFNVKSVGLSLVNNIQRAEIAYITLSSSHVSWGETAKDGYFVKFHNEEQIHMIEKAFNKYEEAKSKKDFADPLLVIDNENNFEVNLRDLLIVFF